ncbi:MAG: hypothetical protein KJ905_02050 [Nanoarchaeota archaeon]|nr:hypothetical protein [Nanoarchaeota archaeon]MBU1501536.1 hypothetical protein [Nanoarchaeota archaeon]
MSKDIDEILRKYGAKIDAQIDTDETHSALADFSSDYQTFKGEMAPEITRYEKWCKSLGSVVKLKISEKDAKGIQRSLKIAHLDLEPWQPLTLSIMTFMAVFFLGVLISVAIVFLKGSLAAFPTLFFFLTILVSVFLFYFMKAYPERLANKWRLKASSQMVPAILYVVVYMRHTPNLERAIAFASQHLQYPLALDLKKVFYDVQVGKFSTIKASLDNYLETWRDYSVEFIEGFHLIESSLYEPDDTRRILTLEKSLKIVLDGVYDKMLTFTHEVKSPLTNVYMLGVVLPTLGLALLPLATAMLGGLLTWVHIFIFFNLIIPFVVFYLTDKIVFLRPGGYGETSLLERNPFYYKYKSKKPYFKAAAIVLPFMIIGLLPFIFQYTPFPEVLGFQKDYSFVELGLGILGDGDLFGFVDSSSGTKGPFGVGALIFSMFIPLGIAMFFSIAYKDRTKELIVERTKTKQLEVEFNNSLFQIGNRLGNGVPPELIFGKVAESAKGLRTEDFFLRVDYNIKQAGMNVERAIFDSKRGAIIHYPSDLISISMKILVESAKKGLKIAAVSMMSISEYVKNIQKITLRLKDMLAEVLSDMKSNMNFLAPLLSGVVVGLAAMITSILSRLGLEQLQGESASSGLGNIGAILDIFDVTKMIPPYFLQIIIGIYLIEIIFILTKTLVTVESGEDKLLQMNSTGKNFSKGMILYFITGLVATITLFVLVGIVLGNLA